MQQPIEVLTDDTAPARGSVPRRLRVVSAGEPAQRLVTYVVLAPTHLAPEDLFSPQVVVHPVAPLELIEPDGTEADGTEAPPARLVPAAEPAPERSPGRSEPGIQIDLDRRTARVDGAPLDLTYLEFEVLAHFVAHPFLVHSRTQLLELIWGYQYAGDGRTVDVHIARLRRKLGPVLRNTIHTVRRAGYKYVPLRSGTGADR